MREERLDTAHETWDRWWDEAKQRARWSDPEPAVTELFSELDARGATTVLDVGTGIGRHALAYARGGFSVIATDPSPTGLEELRRSAEVEQLSIDLRLGSFLELPVEGASIDHVLAWNVLYHGDEKIVADAFRECRRAIRDRGTFQLTMLSKRNRNFGIGEEVRPDTFVDRDSDEDKAHPHFYADAVGVTSLLAAAGFATRSLADLDQQPPGGFHWVVLAEAV